MAFTDFNAANSQRLRRNAQRMKKADFTNTLSLSSTGGLQIVSGQLGIKLNGASLTLGASGLSLTDGDKGDVTVSSTGTVWTIDNDVVTFAKIQNITDARLLGRSAGSNGDMQEIILGTGLSFTGTTLNASAGGVATDVIWDAKGDLAVGTGSDTAVKLTVGANEKILVAASGETTGLAWRSPLVATSLTIGVDNNATSASKVAITGTTGKTLTSAEITAITATAADQAYERGFSSCDISCATGGDTFTLTLDVEGTTVVAVQTHVFTMAGTETLVPVHIEWEGGWDVAGSSGKATGWLKITYGTTATVYYYAATPIASHTTINTTGATNRFLLSGQWSTARAGNDFRVRMNHQEFVSRGRSV